MPEADDTRRQEIVQRRLVAMGLEARPLPGARGFVATLRLGSTPFPGSRGASRRFDSVTFATVGLEHIKCLRPLALFHLPMIKVGDCQSAADLEARIRSAWRSRQDALDRAQRWAEKLGASPRAAADVPVLEIGLGVEDRESRARLVEARRVILPGRGPLSGVRLRRAEDRVFAPDRGVTTALELDLAISARLEELARLDARMQREARLARARLRPEPARGGVVVRPHRVLVVGPNLCRDDALLEGLRARGYQSNAVRSAAEALRLFDAASCELVLAETDLGRFEGVELIPALRALPGVEELPVVIVDDRPRPDRREAARAAGAAGYLVRPFEVSRIADGLAGLVRRPRRRRWTRYRERLAVRGATGDEAVTGDLGRGGMLIWTEREVALHSVERFTLSLPELARPLPVDAEVMHRTSIPGQGRTGLGLRFNDFPERGEESLIAHLRSLEPATPEDDGVH
jgi:two-component system chemotaxis response regulator CheY